MKKIDDPLKDLLEEFEMNSGELNDQENDWPFLNLPYHEWDLEKRREYLQELRERISFYLKEINDKL